MDDEHELLVHISAPTTRQNDQLYRSLADAYLDFRPHRKNVEETPQHDVSSHFATSRVSDHSPLNKGNSFRESVNTSILSTNKDSYGSFPSHLSSDEYPKGYVGASSDDVGEDDFAPTSSRLARLERIHQNWKAQVTPKSSAASKRPSIKDVPSSPEDADTAFIEATQAAVQALQSQLQDSFSMTSENTSGDESDARDVTQEASSSPAETAERTIVATADEPDAPSATSSPQVPLADVNRRESTRLEIGSDIPEAKTPASPGVHPKSSSVVPTQQESFRSSDAPKPISPSAEDKASENNRVQEIDNSGPPMDFTDYPEIVESPAPKIGVESPETWPRQVTPYLEALKEQYPGKFKPVRKSRDPVGNERGHWLIDLSTWPAQAQKDLWDGVCEPLKDGRLGWGAYLYREKGTSEALGMMQLFNWGELAEHMWLLLWVCSKGKIAGAGLKWKAGRDVILVMA
ncbi:uncharacterized protein J4E92_008963 [Alternaria infectoria]|uniref:uncharacterized protein n=1 Tax=Alternaria infectoria TaxID=45303 RepID=UPI0022203B0C|nr:uncharacterized protein J4E92_008963 [Alternaria infectoria]KAI4917569.1 hypothetical protein J4E92_008963 [Alternaria infectoria]